MLSQVSKVLIAVFALSGLSLAHAQQSEAQDQPDAAPASEQKQLDLSDSEVETFAKARSAVQKVRT